MTNLRDIDCFLLDMDGTIYLSNELIHGSKTFLESSATENKKIVFFTNNSSRGSEDYLHKLQKLNISVKQEQIITSGLVTVDYIQQRKPDAKVYLLGTPSLNAEFKGGGLELVSDITGDIDYLVLGFDTSLTYKKLWDAHELILRGVPYIATNPDYVCPLSGGKTMPDCGSMINLLKTSTGKEPLVIGKPNTIMVEYVAKRLGVPLNKIAMVGDRIYTDMEMARRSGITGILVLSGESKIQDVENAKNKPDFVFDNLGMLAEFLWES